jgi:sporulation protein YlmC with PRC-barrel domain
VLTKYNLPAILAVLVLAAPAAAQSTSGSTDTTSPGSSTGGADNPANSTSTKTMPGWGGTQGPKSNEGGPVSGQTSANNSGSQSAQNGSQPGQAAPGGLITINPTSVLVTYYTAQPADTLASKLMKATVYNTDSQKIGNIEDLLIDQGRNIDGVIIGVGGFLGLGERYISLPPSSVVLTPQPNGSYRAVINVTKEGVRDAPEFKFQGNQSR